MPRAVHRPSCTGRGSEPHSNCLFHLQPCPQPILMSFRWKESTRYPPSDAESDHISHISLLCNILSFATYLCHDQSRPAEQCQHDFCDPRRRLTPQSFPAIPVCVGASSSSAGEDGSTFDVCPVSGHQVYIPTDLQFQRTATQHNYGNLSINKTVRGQRSQHMSLFVGLSLFVR